MRTCFYVVFVLLFIIVAGCSGGGKSPTAPEMEQGTLAQDMNDATGDLQILASGTMNLDEGTVEYNRTASPYYNVTSFVGSNFSYYINGFTPPDTFDITLIINNVSPWVVHDVVIVFDKLYGKTVLNPDSYSDLLQPWDVDPFIAFRKEDANRAFPPIPDTEQLLLKVPGGCSALVDFFIAAHIGGNTGGVYEIRDWNVDGKLRTDGGEATIQVRILDHQNDVTMVMADTAQFTGNASFLSPTPDPEIWEVTISNTEGVPEGVYEVAIMTTSPSSHGYNVFNYFEIEVFPQQPTEFGIDIGIEGDTFFDYPDLVSQGHHGMACRGDTFYLTFFSKDATSDEGAIFFTKSTDAGDTWSSAVPLTSTTNNLEEKYACMALGENNIYIVFDAEVEGAQNDEVHMLVSPDDGESWDEYDPSSGLSNYCRSASVCVDTHAARETVYISLTHGTDNGERIRVVRTYYDDIGAYSHSTVSNNYDPLYDVWQSSVHYDPEFDHLVICWVDENITSGSGTRVLFDTIDIDEWPYWNEDLSVSDNWSDGDYEYEPSMAVNPVKGIAGIMYRFAEDDLSAQEVRFVKVDHEDFLDIRISPTVLVYHVDGLYIYGSSLQCDESGRWLGAWFAELGTWNYDCYFNESLDDGATWINEQILNDVVQPYVYNPTLATNGGDVCVAWADARSGVYEIYIDHGVY